MALLNGTALSAPSANASMILDAKLTQELWELQQAVIDRKHPQFNVSDEVIKQLKDSIAAAGLDTNTVGNAAQDKMMFNRESAQHNSEYRVGESKMQGIQGDVDDENERWITALYEMQPFKPQPPKEQRATWLVIDGEPPATAAQQAQLDGQYDSAPIDLDVVLAKANSLLKPVFVTKTTPAPSPSAKSSFDENDYYSSQVQSAWSSDDAATKVKKSEAFTADFEPLDVVGEMNGKRKKRKADGLGDVTRSTKRPLLQDEVDDDYEPAELSPAMDGNISDAYLERTAGTNPLAQAPDSAYINQPVFQEADSDYEPGQVSQEEDDDDEEYDPQSAPEPSPRVVRNNLTQIAAPQPNRVSPLTMQKQPQAEFELVDGRPEVAKKRKSRVVEVTYERQDSPDSPAANYATLNRMSSASPPLQNPAAARRQKKKERKLKRKELEQKQRANGKRRGERQVSGRQKQNAGTATRSVDESAQYNQQSQSHHVRLGSGFVPAGSRTVQEIYNPIAYQPQYINNEQYVSTRASSVVHRVSDQGYQPIYAPLEQSGYRQAQVTQAPRPPNEGAQVVVDQFGNRYYAAPEQVIAQPAQSPPRHSQAQFGQAQLIDHRAPSRAFTPAPAYSEYNPTEVRMLPPQLSTRRDGAPLDVIEQINGKRYRVQEIQEEPRQFLEQSQYQNSSYGLQRPDEQRQFGLQPPPGIAYEQLSRIQPMAPPATRAPSQVPFERTYNIRPETSQLQAQDLYSPDDIPQLQRDTRGERTAQVFQVPHARIGSVAPIQYIQATPRQGSIAPIQYVQRASSMGLQQMRPASVVPAQSEYDPAMPSSGMTRQMSSQQVFQEHDYGNALPRQYRPI